MVEEVVVVVDSVIQRQTDTTGGPLQATHLSKPKTSTTPTRYHDFDYVCTFPQLQRLAVSSLQSRLHADFNPVAGFE